MRPSSAPSHRPSSSHSTNTNIDSGIDIENDIEYSDNEDIDMDFKLDIGLTGKKPMVKSGYPSKKMPRSQLSTKSLNLAAKNPKSGILSLTKALRKDLAL